MPDVRASQCEECERMAMAGLLTSQPTFVLALIGVACIVVGVMRLLGLMPRLTLNSCGRRDYSVGAGIVIIVLGAVLLGIAALR
jgi:ABC-type dipeptide/oligopeptide/nickel transport system permease component